MTIEKVVRDIEMELSIAREALEKARNDAWDDNNEGREIIEPSEARHYRWGAWVGRVHAYEDMLRFIKGDAE
jgi:hypothetical protein